MTQESGLTREEIEAMDEDFGAPEQRPDATQEDQEAGREQLEVRSQEPEAKS